jgi:glycerol-3-phosphate dehydrogenase
MALPGGDIESYDELVAEISEEIGDAWLAPHLAGSYGSRWRGVWSEILADGRGDTPLVDGLPYTLGELRYCARNEMVCTLGDLLIRRTKIAFETRDHGASIAERVAAGVADVLEWGEPEMRASLAAYANEVSRIFAIEP